MINCNMVGYFAKMCRSKSQSKSSYNQQMKLLLKHRNNTANVYLITDDEQDLRTTNWETGNQVFEGIAWRDSIDIFSKSDTCNASHDSKSVNVQQMQKSEAFTNVNMLSTDKVETQVVPER